MRADSTVQSYSATDYVICGRVLGTPANARVWNDKHSSGTRIRFAHSLRTLY